jgi:hypothetical protein
MGLTYKDNSKTTEARTTNFLSFRDALQGKVNVRKLAALVQIVAVLLGECYQY